MYKSIQFGNDFSSVMGYICDVDDESWRYSLVDNRLLSDDQACELLEVAKRSVQDRPLLFAFLTTLFVEERYRTKAYGSSLMSDFLNFVNVEQHNQEAELLVVLHACADKSDKQIALLRFYDRFGFIKMTKATTVNDCGAVMVHSQNENLITVLSSKGWLESRASDCNLVF